MYTEFALEMQQLEGETRAAVIREKMQAHYNIMEQKVRERIQAKNKSNGASAK